MYLIFGLSLNLDLFYIKIDQITSSDNNFSRVFAGKNFAGEVD